MKNWPIWALLLAPASLFAQTEYREVRVTPPPAQVPTYEILRTAAGINIDGKADEQDWKNATVIDFVFPWNDTDQEPAQTTAARMLWDDKNLYISYICADPYLDSEVTQHDGPVYQEDAVEIFATPNPDDISAYFGYEMNINGALLDYMAFGGGTAWTENIHPPWQSEGVQIATSYDGTLNDHSDTDRGWVLEISIPFDNFRHLSGNIPPGPGDVWRLNLNRTKGDKGQFSMWSDSHAENPSFHHSTYFGAAHFSEKSVGH
jgi:hypothetical protein